MLCPKCNKDNDDENLFCSGCGYNLKMPMAQVQEQKLKSNRNGIKIAGIIAGVVVVLIIAGFFGYQQIQMNKVINEYKAFLDKEDYEGALTYYEDHAAESRFVKKADSITRKRYEEAVKKNDSDVEIAIFNSGLLTDNYVETLEASIIEELETIKKQFVDADIEYAEAEQVCFTYEKYKNDAIAEKTKEVYKYVKNLNDSRSAYKAGMEAAEKNDNEETLYELSKVIEEDENYAAARAKMEEVVPAYKEEVFANVDSALAGNNYAAAINHLESLQKYCSDSDVSAKLSEVQQLKTAYEGEQERLKIEEYKNNQEVEVISTKVFNDGYYLRFMKATSVVRNNSNKVAKEVTFGTLLFDENGYPVDVEYKIYQGKYSNECNCAFESCNILPGNQYGDNRTYDLPDQCRQAKACVRSVTYTDGTIWNNPYYSYWLEENYNSY